MNWTDKKTYQESLDILGQLTEICAHKGGPEANQIANLVKAKDYLSVVNYRINYETVGTRDAYYARQIQGFFQKLEDLNLGIDKEAAAARRFAESENMCQWTNRRLVYHRRKPQERASHVDVILHYAARKIGSIIGSCPPVLDELKPEFGPGANTSVKAAVANPRAKLSARLECSHEMSPTVAEFLSETPHWVAISALKESTDSWVVEVVTAPGKLIFVPKNAKTYRSIVVEPLLNSFHQKGIGSYMKDCLKRSGIDLRDQTINQRLALEGSMTGQLCTVDLSMASDCLSIELVHELLPPEWCDLLGRVRTGYVDIPDAAHYWINAYAAWNLLNNLNDDTYVCQTLKLEKFSSMGNGFTFELESLIFYGLVYGVCRQMHLPTKDISVFGDDLIVPTAAYSRLAEVLEYCGFSVNSDKSYSSGPFRESCGADYLSGIDIRPFYQKTLISEQSLYTMHNWFKRKGEFELAEAVYKLCNPDLMLTGPDGFGDGHLVRDGYTLRLNRKAQRSGWCGGYFDTYVLRPRRFKKPLPGDAVLPVYSVYTRSGAESPTDPDIVRGSKGYAKISIYTLVTS